MGVCSSMSISMRSMYYYPSVSPHAAAFSAKSNEGNSCQVPIFYTWVKRDNCRDLFWTSFIIFPPLPSLCFTPFTLICYSPSMQCTLSCFFCIWPFHHHWPSPLPLLYFPVLFHDWFVIHEYLVNDLHVMNNYQLSIVWLFEYSRILYYINLCNLMNINFTIGLQTEIIKHRQFACSTSQSEHHVNLSPVYVLPVEELGNC